ncbi:MAG: ABC transporter substrate-binding protein, partial [Candidatus Rokubacteria bacterium]|nr:ABC transporter substrate-binding protein [Candidatus Rokubacteria bacterium]
MIRPGKCRTRWWGWIGTVIALVLVAQAWAPAISGAQTAQPIRIGFGMALTGGLAANGKAALLAMQIWAEDVNKKGGLLGRRVELVYY